MGSGESTTHSAFQKKMLLYSNITGFTALYIRATTNVVQWVSAQKLYSFGNPGINIGTLRAYSANPMGVANQMSGIGEWGVATRLTNKTITATPASPPPPITIPPSRLPPLTQKNTPITGPFEKGVMLRWKGACPPR